MVKFLELVYCAQSCVLFVFSLFIHDVSAKKC